MHKIAPTCVIIIELVATIRTTRSARRSNNCAIKQQGASTKPKEKCGRDPEDFNNRNVFVACKLVQNDTTDGMGARVTTLKTRNEGRTEREDTTNKDKAERPYG